MILRGIDLFSVRSKATFVFIVTCHCDKFTDSLGVLALSTILLGRPHALF